ncbi:MAG: 50S ribosomal protein L4 [candidate division WOR-3 bacterium]|nr:50S ribosomal protein L4 [candidate division WOR-3 bacterium]
MDTKIFNQNGEEVGTVTLPEKIFKAPINKTLLWETVKILLDNQRQGTAKTKTRAEVRGGGKKPWPQKGTGLARHGSIRSPIWRKGGVVFGPKPRDYYKTIPQRKKTKALLSALSAAAQEDRIRVIEDLNFEKPNTKRLKEILKKINLNDVRVLITTDTLNKNLILSVRNIPKINLKRSSDINCYDVLWAEYVLFTRGGLSELEKRCDQNK